MRQIAAVLIVAIVCGVVPAWAEPVSKRLVIPASVLEMRLAQTTPAPRVSRARWIVIGLAVAGAIAIAVAISSDGDDEPQRGPGGRGE